MTDNDLFKLYINTSNFFGADTDNVLTVSINKDKNLELLKKKISKKLGIKPEEFNVKRQNVSREYKDLKMSMM